MQSILYVASVLPLDFDPAVCVMILNMTTCPYPFTASGETMFIQRTVVSAPSKCLAAVLACWAFLAVSAYAYAFDSVALQHEAVSLTQAERAYLKEHKKVTLCVDPDWVPYEHIDANGKHVGIAADLLALI